MKALKFNNLEEFITAILKYKKLYYISIKGKVTSVIEFTNDPIFSPFRLNGEAIQGDWGFLYKQTYYIQEPLKDKQPVWCWDEIDTARRIFAFWDSKNNCTYHNDGVRNGPGWDCVVAVAAKDITDWMLELQKNLKD